MSLSAKVRYDIELDWDYAYLTVNGTAVPTNLSTTTNPNGQNFGQGITGDSGGNFVDLTADLSAFAGQTVEIGFRYWTDPAVANPGFFVDNIAITGQELDGGETDPGWAYNGFIRTESTVTLSFFNAYFAEFRTYLGYDDSLRPGPTTSGSWTIPTCRTTSSTSPIRTACWCGTTTSRSLTTASVTIAPAAVVVGSTYRWTPILTCCSDLTGRYGGLGSRATTRPSASRQPTRSASTTTVWSSATADCPGTPFSTTPRATGCHRTPRSGTSGGRVFPFRAPGRPSAWSACPDRTPSCK